MMPGGLEALPGGYKEGVQNLDGPQEFTILYV